MSSSNFYRRSGIALIIGSVLILVTLAVQEVDFGREAFDIIVEIVSLVVGIVYSLAHNTNPLVPIQNSLETGSNIVSLIQVIAIVFLLFGFFGLYRRQSQRAGVLGLFGFLLTFLSHLLSGIIEVYSILFIDPQVPATGLSDAAFQALTHNINLLGDANGILSFVAAIVLGIAVIRANVFSRVAGILIIVGGVLDFPLSYLASSSESSMLFDISYVSTLLFYTGFAWIGYTLFIQATKVEVPEHQG